MTAKFIPIGEPAHASERQALRFLVDGLPDTFTVYGNPWLVERSGAVLELDAVVVAPHAIFVVEIKGYRGRVEGTDHDWYVPYPVRSPIKKNRLSAQILNGQLKSDSYRAGQVWVQGLVFLSAASSCGVRGPASQHRIHTRKTILTALQDEDLVKQLSRRRSLTPSDAADRELLKLLKGAEQGPKPVRRVREYEIVDTLETGESFSELLARHAISGVERRLRIYMVPPLAGEEKRRRSEERARWEAQVLGRLGHHAGILSADSPFSDDAGIVLPMEHFEGVTLTTWVERYGPGPQKKAKADLKTRTDLWIRIAETIDYAHRQGVVHRLLRPDVVLVEDEKEPTAVRVTGFELAKQLAHDTTVSLTTISDERLDFAAPEVVRRFSDAVHASDQFSLGAVLGLLLTGQRLFESTRQLLTLRRLVRHVRDLAPRTPQRLDEAVTRMVAVRPTDRFPTLEAAIADVRAARDPDALTTAPLFPEAQAHLDVENLVARTRLEPDYEVEQRLGQGGMAVVYAARHLASGRTRALKIAHPTPAAEEALRGEYQTLSKLDHPGIVRVVDLSKIVEGHLTLVMERVGDMNLRQWLAEQPTPDPHTARRLAEDLLAGLGYLEQVGVTHKDLKPDNLLVGDDGLTIIDFSLAEVPEDAPYCGTALYRDPVSTRWTHGTDRFAGALCLFELFAGRHAFDGQVPEPGQEPSIHEEDIDPPSLAAFFRKALNPAPEMRYASAREMRDAMLVALGQEIDLPPTTGGDDAAAALPGGSGASPAEIEVSTSLRTTALPQRAINALARSQVLTVGDLLALSDDQVRVIHAIGAKTAADIIAFQEELRARGLVAPRHAVKVEQPLAPDLADSPEPLTALALSDTLREALEQHGLPTVGAVAALSHAGLLSVPGIGRGRLAKVVEALYRFLKRDAAGDEAHTLDRLWELASDRLSEEQRGIVERVLGILDEPETQDEIARDLGWSQPKVSRCLNQGLEELDMAVLTEPLETLYAILDNYHGIVRLDEVGAGFEEHWPAGVVSKAGMVRLLVRLAAGRCQLIDVTDREAELDPGPLVVLPVFDKVTLLGFAREVMRLAGQWPLVEPEAARRSLAAYLPHYQGNALHLGVRLCRDVELTSTDQLFIGPVEPRYSVDFVLQETRGRISLEDLERQVRRTFGEETPFPDMDSLLALVHELGHTVQGAFVVLGESHSVSAPSAPLGDEVAAVGKRTPEEVVRDMLRDASGSRGFRMLVAPPERSVEIARSVAEALKATWVSFEDAFFRDHEADLPALERAERFVAQRDALTEAAEETLFDLLEEHGKPGRVVVLGDTALLGLCEALDLPRRLYDETLSGSKGFWVLVVPGVIQKHQPRFNEGQETMWHLEGTTLALLNPLPNE